MRLPSWVSRSVVTEPQSPHVPLQLYDLMTMAFKYQVLLCPRPKDILLVTFNHLDTIKDFIHDSPGILNQVDETFRQLIEVRAVEQWWGTQWFEIIYFVFLFQVDLRD